MVSKMAPEMRPPSPPLPPDPSEYQKSRSSHSRGSSVSSRSSPLKTASSSQRPTPPNADRRRSAPPPPTHPPGASILSQPQQVEAAVNSALDQSQQTRGLDAEFIKRVTEQVTEQVTAQVLQNLQRFNLAGVGATGSPVPSAAPQDSSPRLGQSPVMSSPDHVPTRYTPPSSPDHPRGAHEYLSSPSPDPEFEHDRTERIKDDLSASESTKSGDTFGSDRSGLSGIVRRNTATNRGNGTMPPEAQSRRTENSPRGTIREPPSPTQQLNRDRPPEEARSGAPRSRASSRADPEETTLERIWQPLFDNGKPTVRLSQVLRGLAMHIIEDYEPKASHGISTAKMMRFFNETKVDNELYPWQIIFGGKMSNSALSTMYCKLLCQHQFVQSRLQEAPTLPALTQQGFDAFMTCLIQAHPDYEYERLAKAVMNMPISNADNKSERFPKELSRRLFPSKPNLQAEQRFVSSLQHEPLLVGKLKSTTAKLSPHPPTSQPPQSQSQGQPQSQQQSSFSERERQPYSRRAAPMCASVEDEELEMQSSIPERERKPYSAREGMGKVYDSKNDNNTSASAPRSRKYSGDENRSGPPGQHRPDAPPSTQPATRTSRTNTGPGPRPNYSSNNNTNSGPSNPINIPPRHHSVGPSQGLAQTNPSSGYGSSTSRSFYGRGSDSFDNSGSTQSPQFGSSLHQTMSASGTATAGARDPLFETDEDLRRHFTARAPPPGLPPSGNHTTNNNSNNNRGPFSSGPYDDDPMNGRGRPIPPRSTNPGINYDYGTGPPIGSGASNIGMPPHPSSNGSFPSRPPPPPSSGQYAASEDRRRSMYAAPPSTNPNPTQTGFNDASGGVNYGAGAQMGGPHPPPPLPADQRSSFSSSTSGGGGMSSNYNQTQYPPPPPPQPQYQPHQNSGTGSGGSSNQGPGVGHGQQSQQGQSSQPGLSNNRPYPSSSSSTAPQY